MSKDRPSPPDVRRASEDSEARESVRIGEPRGRHEPGEVVVGDVDSGPTGEREGGDREATPANRILTVAAGVIIVIAAVLALVLLR